MIAADGKILFVWDRKKYRTPKQQKVLDMKIEGMSHEEIAEKLGIGIGAVNQLSHRGNKRILKNKMNDWS